MKVRLNAVNIGDKEWPNKFGTGSSRLVKFKQYLPEGERDVSGFVDSKKLSEWTDGAEMDLDITKNDKGYWGFKVLTKTSLVQNEQHDKVMEGLREIFKKLNAIEDKLSVKGIFDIAPSIPSSMPNFDAEDPMFP